MVNESELLLNIVRYKEPKMLTGSDQNGKQSDNLLNFGVTRIIALPVELTEPNPFICYLRRTW